MEEISVLPRFQAVSWTLLPTFHQVYSDTWEQSGEIWTIGWFTRERVRNMPVGAQGARGGALLAKATSVVEG